jgi:hypothetical protein
MSEHPIINETLNAQPFYVVDDEAYRRMLDKLNNGQQFVKTYLSVCPHRNVSECKCPFQLNFLKDGIIVRSNSGKIKPVVSLSSLKI